MTDFALALNADRSGFDLALDSCDLATDSGLRSAVIVSLYTERRAEADDVLPDGTTDRRGHWADPTLGSRLWLLDRAKETDDVLARAQEYAQEALAWLVADGVARAVNVTAAFVQRGVLALTVTITLADRERYQDVFNLPIGNA